MMRRSAIVAVSYCAVMAVLTYGWLEPHWDGALPAAYAPIALVHLAAGALIASWWALALPAVPFLMALPAGYPQSDFEPLPTAAVFFFMAPVELLLVAVGVSATRGSRRRRASA